MDDDSWVTIGEAAKLAMVSRRTIYSWLNKGFIKDEDIRVTPAGKRRIRKGALLRPTDKSDLTS